MQRVVSLALALGACLVSTVTTGCKAPRTVTTGAHRSFRFEYEAVVKEFPAGAKGAPIWIPIPTSDDTQTISNLEVAATVAHEIRNGGAYGNRYLYVEAPLGETPEIALKVACDVTRRELTSLARLPGEPRVDRLLSGDRLAPLSAEAKRRANEAVAGRTGSDAMARGLYERVLADVDYDKSGSGWGRGDLEYVCAAGKGNCSDFHALFIAMARSEEIPALFEIGFPLPEGQPSGGVGGYHCWAWYEGSDGSWRPVDVSEADKRPEKSDYFFGTLCANRVAFSRGRDLVLSPPQAGEPLNFLIYPYVEVDGSASAAKVETKFAFADI